MLDFLSKNVELAKNYSQEMTCTPQISLFFKYVSCSTFNHQNLKKVTFANNLFETFLLKKNSVSYNNIIINIVQRNFYTKFEIVDACV